MSYRAVFLALAMLVAARVFAVPVWAAPAKTAKAGISAEDWGTTQKGDKVKLFTLTGRGGMVARITNFGGVVVDLVVPDRHGKPTDVGLGYDDFSAYEKGGIYSALIGPYANRLSFKFPVDGKIYEQPRPQPRPTPAGAAPQLPRPYIQHSGGIGFQKRMWRRPRMTGRSPACRSPSRTRMAWAVFPAMSR
jgi:aldose 1-epimerase